jgi:UDP-glucose 4-epimerase
MKKVLITGGTGFIGYHLAARLSAGGCDLTLVDNFFRSRKDADLEALCALPNMHLIEADLTNPASWESLDTDFDEVYHLVGVNGTRYFYEIPHEVLRIGVATTMNALEWFRTKNKKGAKILYTSSNEAYAGALEAFGTLPIPTPEEVPLVVADTYNPRWSYGAQKLIGELFFIHYAKAYDLRMSIVRPHNFYGPRAGYEHAIPQIIERIENKTDPFPIFGADETRSFCYIADAVEAIQTVMESDATDGGTYHIGTSEETSIRDLVEQLCSVAGWHPNELDERTSPPGSVLRRLPDVSKIKRDTGWEASTPLTTGLGVTYEWYVSHPNPANP